MSLDKPYHLLHAYLQHMLVFHGRRKFKFVAVLVKLCPRKAYLAQHAYLEAFPLAGARPEFQPRHFAVTAYLAVFLHHREYPVQPLQHRYAPFGLSVKDDIRQLRIQRQRHDVLYIYNAVHRRDEFRLEHDVRAVAGTLVGIILIAVQAVRIQEYPLPLLQNDDAVARMYLHPAGMHHEKLKVRVPVHRHVVPRDMQGIHIVLYREACLSVLDKLLKVLFQRHVELFHQFTSKIG